MIERTLVLIKPDGVQRALVGEIISRFERTGMKIVGLKMSYADKELAGKHYADDEEWLRSVGEKTKKAYEAKGADMKDEPIVIGRRIRAQLMDFISMSPTIALCIEGHGAIEKVRAIIGTTAPLNALPGTIRGDFSIDSYGLADASGRAIQNLTHASDSRKNAEREINIWFNKDEIYPYERIDEALIYRKTVQDMQNIQKKTHEEMGD